MELRNINVIQANSGHAAGLNIYMKNIFKETSYLNSFPKEYSNNEKRVKEFISRLRKDKNSICLVAIYNKEIIGTCAFENEKKEKLKHHGELGMTVRKKYWGNGIGTCLLTRLINWAKRNGTVKKLNLKVRIDNIRAIKLYKKMGFKTEGKIEKFHYYRNKYYDFIIMGRDV